ncbi:aldo/keto reductase [Cyclobacterium marinum]|uniref:Aldo/keto reductase n=1 Tax=Cyclobacterium marinum (strain ATCC 25205 / DSM 745 / LMG 13164 / NCIMB 1802) TaxID=880070 RepID=G0IYL8_CYCMS|nr:aldo/keto reductase [Cyclobacterium marinum]AEL26441.1 aldo/keto reductase [Cyclobacterium marinum DSM 745]
MNTRPFGKTGLEFPSIIFGSSALGNLFKSYTKAEKKQILKEAFKQTHPFTVFDTAGKYGAGLALEVLGEFLIEEGIPKENVIITNKLGWTRIPLTTPEPLFEPNIWKGIENDAVQKISYEGILECFEKDNALLQGYVPQLISLHDPDEYLDKANSEEEREALWKDVLGAFTAMKELKDQGKVKGVGVGAKDWKIIKAIYQRVPLDYVMIANSLSLINHPPELMKFVDLLRKDEVGIILAAIFQSGFLTGEDFFDYKRLDPDDAEDQKKIQWRKKFFEVCKAYGVDPFHACIQFSLMIPGVTSIALSVNQPALVKKNLIASESSLPEGFWQELKDKSLISGFPNI